MTTASNSSDLKEQRGHGTSAFPCGLYEVFDNALWSGVKHHWHDEIEILYFMKGSFELIINMKTFLIEEECIYFINPGELHSIIPHTKGLESAVLFHPRILSFDNYDMAQSRILQPLMKGQLYFPRCLKLSDSCFANVKKEYLDIINVFYQGGSYISLEDQTVTDDISSQLFIRAGLLKILGYLSSCHLLTTQEKTDDYRVEIIKKTLAYIRENYQDKLYVRELADRANMNEQYFCRFFKKIIGKTPVTYINEYRISQAITLLQDTELPVMDICLDSGFNNLGNFLREFRKITGTTPLQYRKNFRDSLARRTPSHKSKFRSF